VLSDDRDLKQRLIQLETALFQPAVRADKEQLQQLISDDFIEIAATGVRFDKAVVLTRLPTEAAPRIHADNFELRLLSEHCAQLLYHASLQKAGATKPSLSQRCSIWRLEQDHWRMVYHQGTPSEALEDDSAI